MTMDSTSTRMLDLRGSPRIASMTSGPKKPLLHRNNTGSIRLLVQQNYQRERETYQVRLQDTASVLEPSTPSDSSVSASRDGERTPGHAILIS